MACSTASNTNRRGPRRPRWRLRSAAAIGCALSLACIPAATAKSPREKQTLAPGAHANAAAAAPAAAGEPNAAVPAPEAGAEASGAPAPGAPRHPRRAASASPVAPVSQPSGADAPNTVKGAAKRSEEAARRKEERELRRREAEQRHSEVEQQRLLAAQQRRELIKQHQEGTKLRAQLRGQGREASRRREATAHQLQVKAQHQAARSGLGGSGGKQGGGGAPAAGSSAGSSASLTSGATKAHVASAAPAALVPAASLSAPPQPTLAVGAPLRSTHAGHARVSRRRASATAHAPAAAPLAVQAVAAAGATPLRASTRTAAPVAHRAKSAALRSAASSPSPIVTTITRIVGVVPGAVWALVAALVALALALAARTGLSARSARRLEIQRSQLLDDVGLLQAALLPVPPIRLGPVGTTAAYRPAAGPAAGGDFYDVFALDDGRLAVIVGDVSGHGREALPHTALVRFTLRAYLEAGLSPRVAMQTAGAVLERQLGSSFATVVAATYDPRARLLVYSCAGHPPPIVLGSDDFTPVTIASAPPVGVGMRTGTRQSTISIPGAATVCFHTDGVTEARVGTELYGSGRLTAALAELGPEATAGDLLGLVTEQTDRRPDDMAACLLRVAGGAEAPVVVAEELELDREEAAGERAERFLLACGLEPYEVEEVTRSARTSAERVGKVIVELRRDEGGPVVTLQHDNLAYIQPRQAARRADLKVSL